MEKHWPERGDLLQIEGDPNQLHEVLYNLALNASQAIQGEGTLTFTTRNIIQQRTESPDTVDFRPGPYVRIEVADTGVGMDEQTLERAFEPFFTSNRHGEATGLGLSMVYGAVKNHGGQVTLESEVNQGTRVILHLPAIEPETRQGQSTAAAFRPSPREGWTILLVDDEPLIRKGGGRLLRRFGYQVVLAENGKHALERYRERGDEISLVLLDLMMPVMDGAQTFEQLHKLDPTLPVILCSGYSREGMAEKLLEQGANGFVEKPFNWEELAKMIDTILERSSV